MKLNEILKEFYTTQEVKSKLKQLLNVEVKKCKDANYFMNIRWKQRNTIEDDDI